MKIRHFHVGVWVAWLMLLFCFGNVLGLSVDVAEDVLLYPNQEFYLIMTIENAGIESAVNIVGYSEELNVSWNRSILLLKDSGVKVGFIINPIRDVGEYEIVWTARAEDGESVGANTKILVSDMEGALGKVIGYYGFELDALENSKSVYASDAKKNIEVAQNLADRGMIFEASKYLDFTRESLKMAIEEESPAKSSSFDWARVIRILGVGVLVLTLAVLGFFVLMRLGKRILEFTKGLGRRNQRLEIRGESGVAKPKYVLDIEEVRKKIRDIQDEDRRRELMIDLENCEEKFRIGLPMLGRAYLERIGRAVKRERG